jgi:hypothetical protein
MTPQEFEDFSEATMGPILAKMEPAKRAVLIALALKLAHPSAHAWLHKKLAETDPAPDGPDTLKLHFIHPRDYPPQTVDRIENRLKDSLAQWGERTYFQIDEHFRKHPEEKTAVQLEGFCLDFRVNGNQVWGLLAMMRIRQEPETQFVCFIGSEALIRTQRERIVNEAKSGVSAQARTIIVEQEPPAEGQ